jgi:hypothetical protein
MKVAFSRIIASALIFTSALMLGLLAWTALEDHIPIPLGHGHAHPVLQGNPPPMVDQAASSVLSDNLMLVLGLLANTALLGRSKVNLLTAFAVS